MERFLSGQDLSMDAAGRLGVALDKAFPEDDRVQDLVLALAMYRPGGGEYLYNEEQICAAITDVRDYILRILGA